MEHKDHKEHRHNGHERRSSLRLSDLYRIVENAVPEQSPENGEHKPVVKHTGHAHAHAEHERPAKR